jgi:hypothetical protein
VWRQSRCNFEKKIKGTTLVLGGINMAGILFIGGHRKSGTTMLSRLFDNHPQIFVAPTDINVLYAYYPEWISDKYTELERLSRLKLVVIQATKKALGEYVLLYDFSIELFERNFMKFLQEIDTQKIGQVLNALIETYKMMIPHGVKWLVLKETGSEIYAHHLFKQNGMLKFLHLVRDPRDNFAAIRAGLETHYSRFGNDYIDTLGSVLVRYSYGIKWLKHNLNIYGTDKYKILHFEKLVMETKSIMEDISRWLEIEMRGELLTPTHAGNIYSGNNYEGATFFGVDNRHIGAWRKRITNDEAAIVEFILREEMDYLGYARATDLSVGATLASDFYAAMNYKYFFADSFLRLSDK